MWLMVITFCLNLITQLVSQWLIYLPTYRYLLTDIPDSVLRSAIGKYDGNVYEALFDSAQKSILNQIDPFVGYEEYLRPHTNKELLKKGNVAIPNMPAAGNAARAGPKM